MDLVFEETIPDHSQKFIPRTISSFNTCKEIISQEAKFSDNILTFILADFSILSQFTCKFI